MATQTCSTYVYQPLIADQIRVLRIIESNDLFTVALEKAPPFVALSYTWDDQPRQHILLVGGARLKIIEMCKYYSLICFAIVAINISGLTGFVSIKTMLKKGAFK